MTKMKTTPIQKDSQKVTIPNNCKNLGILKAAEKNKKEAQKKTSRNQAVQ